MQLLTLNINDNIHYTHLMIDDLCNISGFTFSRIAIRLKISPSTIQKCRQFENRALRVNNFQKLLRLYCRVFFGDFRTVNIAKLVDANPEKFISHVPPIYRGVIGALAKSPLEAIIEHTNI